MNIEELSKSQLILLTILVNFVTAVATAILTVSLLDQAPPTVTQTVNHVVEHTIETVSKAAPAVATVVKNNPPAPSNQDLVTSAIGADASRTVALYDANTGTTTSPIAVGTFLPDAHAVVVAKRRALPAEVDIEFPDNTVIAASRSHESDSLIIYGFADNAVLPSASSPKLLPSNSLQLGQTALTIGTNGSAATGIVSRITEEGVYTTLPSLGFGSVVVDLSGNIIGIEASSTPGFLIPADDITTLLDATTTAAAS